MNTIWWIITHVAMVIPFWVLAPNYRLPQPAALIALVPLGPILLLWVMAFRDVVKIPGVDK